MSSLLRLALVQFDPVWENPQANMRQLEKQLTGISNTDLILLPEMWSTGFTMNTAHASEPAGGPALQWMKRLAGETQSHIAGSISVKDGHLAYNRFYAVSPTGQTWHYDKRHLFSYGKEDQYYTSGQRQVYFQIHDWTIMPIVCYDLRFPVWCRNVNDYDLMIVVANWPVARVHHWDALLRARAIENQCYVAGVNRIGRDGLGLEYNGHSTIYDMNGMTLLEMNEMDGVGQAHLDLDALRKFRSQYRFLQDRDPFQL